MIFVAENICQNSKAIAVFNQDPSQYQQQALSKAHQHPSMPNCYRKQTPLNWNHLIQ
jgi:hypothetical protein